MVADLDVAGQNVDLPAGTVVAESAYR
jgi:hypothetical protein